MRHLLAHPAFKPVLALCMGISCLLGYAPFYLYPMPMIALAVLFALLQGASTPARAALLGYLFGLGFFCGGVSWIYVSLHDFGGMPWWFAGFATFTFCAFLALFTAAMAWLSARSRYLLLAAPMCWVLLEWVRSWIFTGFPWLNVGYSQVPYGPLAGLAPVLGVYGMSLAVACASSLLVVMREPRSRRSAILAFVVLWLGGSMLKQVEWSRPQGEPVSVALVQGNIAQDIKWQPEVARQTLQQYLDMSLQSSARLIVLPETALPLLIQQVPQDYLQQLAEHARANHGDILLGAVELDEQHQYFNSMLSYGSAPTQVYRKSHLVPFGEYIPLKQVFGWIYRDWLNMPLTDLARGSTQQRPMHIAGQQVAVNICYEDVFGEEIIRQLPQASLLVNASNDAWYGHSLAAHQHLQMSQTRALESGRMMLRATNTGATAIIDTHGQVVAQLPHFVQATLQGTVQGYHGTTPYVSWGNWPVIACVLISVILLWGRKKK